MHAIYRYQNRGLVYQPQFQSGSHKYDRNYVVGYAQGSGYLLGATIGIAKHDSHEAWFHNGGEMIILDHETNPNVIKGTGGEDFFGTSCHFSGHHNFPEWGFMNGKSDNRFSAYRWFVETARIPFHSSFTFKYGGLLNIMSSVMYWYQEGPILAQVQHVVSKDEEHSYEHNPPIPPPTGMISHWDVSPHHSIKHFTNRSHLTTPVHYDAVTNVTSEFGFVSFGEHFLPYGTNDIYPVNVFVWARSVVTSITEQVVRLMFTHDDPIDLFLNDFLLYSKNVSTQMGFHTVNIHARLVAGNNTFVVKAANLENMNTRAWVVGLNIYPISNDLAKEAVATKKMMYLQQKGKLTIIDGVCE